MSKFKNFPELKEGDLVVCGSRKGFIMTGRGSYALGIHSELGLETVKITGNLTNPISVLELNTEYPDDSYIPQAVFRPCEGRLIDWYDLTAMLTDPKEYITEDLAYTCVWCKDRDEAAELTVDEVSKLLGYKVKIVGKENK